MVGNVARAVIVGTRRITGLSTEVIAELIVEVGPLWEERHRSRLAARPRRRAVGAGAKHRLVFVDRLLATLVHLRHGTTHDLLACWFAVDRSTITRAIGEVRPLPAMRGCTVAPCLRLLSGRCRRAPRGRWPGRDPGRHRGPGPQAGGRAPGAGPVHLRQEQAECGQGDGRHRLRRAAVVLRSCPARQFCPDITQARQSGLADLLLSGPPSRSSATLAAQRHAHSSRRIRVEHGIAHLKNWRSLARHHGRHEHLADTIQAVAALLSHQQTAAQPTGRAA
ncbi:helix-turn-helix domain-containing protein [Streptomyces sp. URMC 129]|uniref:helix-turn-helix domain-containing protein n=1 Tax=Streptomyces sp. URMC 129 TaxID=3423407 RepID=UPI003F1BA9F5